MKDVSRICSSGLWTPERVPRSSFDLGGGRSSFFTVYCDSGEDCVKGRSGEALCLIRVLLRVDTIDGFLCGREEEESSVLVVEMGMSHEKTRTFINGREPHQEDTVRQRNEGKVQCVA